VIPSTLDKVQLVAEFEDGTQAEGEMPIVEKKKKIKKLSLNPSHCQPTQEVLDAIENADLILLGPGSLYTSVLPNLLIPGIVEKILASTAYKAYVVNVMTQPGETDHFSMSQHWDVLKNHTHEKIVDACFANTASVPEELIKKYRKTDSEPVTVDSDRLESAGVRVFSQDLIKVDGQVRHDPEKLAHFILESYRRETKSNEK